MSHLRYNAVMITASWDQQTTERFWKRVVVNPHGCWEWIGRCDSDRGYGRFRAKGRATRSHRLMYEIAMKSDPGVGCVCHHCDNRRCVRPTHLYLGDRVTNARDRSTRGRNASHVGENNGRAILTAEMVREIRIACSDRQMTYSRIAAMYGVDKETVRHIAIRLIWKHI